MILTRGLWLGALVLAIVGLLSVGYHLRIVKERWGQKDEKGESIPLMDQTTEYMLYASGVAFLIGALGVKIL